MSSEPDKNHGKEIGDIVRSAFSSGDLSRLKDLGPAVQEAVKNIPGVNLQQREGGVPATQSGSQKADVAPMWKGSAAQRKPNSITAGVLSIVLGILGMVAFGLSSVVFSILALIQPLSAVMWPLTGVFAGLFALCCIVTGAGFGKRRLAKRVRDIYALFDTKKVYTLEEMAAELGREPKDIKKDIRKAKKKGMLADLRTDAAFTTVMQGEDTYRMYLDSEKARAEREQEDAERARRLGDPATAELEAFKREGEKTIREIRRANEVIPGEEISEKLSRLEGTSARIVAYVEGHPEKLPEARKFMDYYLPTTLKLVEKYRQYEALEVQPENVRAAKAQIEKSLDKIDLAFNNLLESLYQHDTLDVTTDIEVLETMLEQEGLTGKRFEIDADNRPL